MAWLRPRVIKLQAQLLELQGQLNALTATHTELQIQCSILAAWCEGVEIMRVAQAGRALQQQCGDALGAQLQQLLYQESTLLQELVGAGPADAVCLPSFGRRTMSPADDPMQLLRLVMGPPVPFLFGKDLDDVTMQQAHAYKDAVQETSILLHQLHDAEPAERAAILDSMQQAWERYAPNARNPLQAPARVQALLLDLRTMHADAAAADEHCARMVELVPRLHLSDAQLQVIVHGAVLANRVTAGIRQQRQKLQQQIAELDEGCSLATPPETSRNAAVSGSSGASRAGSSSPSHMQSLQASQQRRKLQEQLVARQKVWLSKEGLMRLLLSAWFVGCLGPDQVTKAAVLAWPYHIRELVLMQQIKQWHDQQQQLSAMVG